VRPFAPRRFFATARALVCVATLQALVPFAAVQVAKLAGAADRAPYVGFVTGGIVATLLFVAPAFVVLHGLGTRACILSSLRLILRLPLALPFAVLAVGVLHAPALLLRAPVIRAGAASDPDWILMALLAQLPAEIVGAVFAAGLAAFFASADANPPPADLWVGRSGHGHHRSDLRPVGRRHRLRDARRAAAQLRYESERTIERARLRELALEDAEAYGDTTGWLAVAARYGTALDRLGSERLARPSTVRTTTTSRGWPARRSWAAPMRSPPLATRRRTPRLRLAAGSRHRLSRCRR
jgi:chromate transport protein ChrA